MDLESVNNYKVYARANEDNFVIKIFSSCFENPTDSDVLIKQGLGDEFVHVGYYELIDENMCHNYKIVNGEMVKTTDEDKINDLISQPTPEPTALEKLQADIDYLAIMLDIEL